MKIKERKYAMKKIISTVLACIIFISIMPVETFAASKPSAPSITSYTAVSSSSIKIGWGSVSGATKYRVDRRRSDESDYKTLTSTYTSTSYTDTGLKAGSRYYYRVYAINSAGTSARSVTYSTYTKPAAPTISSINRDSDTKLTISWSSVSGATKYKVNYRRGDSDSYSTATSGVTSTSYTHTGLTSNSKYWYRVYAIIEGEVGPEGNRTTKSIQSDASATVGNFTKMSRPSNTTDNDNPSNVILSWKKAYGGNDYSYDIYRKSPTDSGFVKIARTTNLTYTDTGLTSGVIYKYKINTVTTDGGSSCTWSDEFYAGPKITSEITLTPQSATSMKISWDKPSSQTSLTYIIKKLVNGEYITYGTTTNTYYVDSGLTTGEKYGYYIQARDSSDNYLTSTYGKSAVLQILPTGVVLNKTTASIGDGETLSLTATISPSNSTNTALTWTSSNTSVATVSSSGVVTAKAKGSAVITVKTANGKTASCTVNVVSCIHTYGNWIVEKDASCTEDGSRYRVCSKCGEKDTEAITATGHSYSDELIIVKEATCTEDGIMARVCTVCGAETDNTPIQASGHTYSENWILEKEATCEENGIEYRECTVCGEKDIRETETIEHSFGEWTGTAATCTEDGYETRICSVCGFTEIKTEKALGHEYEFFGQTTPQGTEALLDIYKCKRCSNSITKLHGSEPIKEGNLSISNYSVTRGGEVTIYVDLQDNPGIKAFKFHLQYDASVFEPVKSSNGRYVQYGTLLQDDNGNNLGTLLTNLSQENVTVSDPQISWQNSITSLGETIYTDNITGNGELFSITFKISDEAPSGTYPISLSYDEGDISDKDEVSIMPTISDGSITIIDGAVIRGDINMDGRINANDSTLLAKYVVTQDEAKKEVMFSENQKQAANVYEDADGEINHKDGIRLAQLIAGYTFDIDYNDTSPVTLLSADVDTIIDIGKCRGMPGTIVEVPVMITNNTGFAGFNLLLDYDKEYLTPLSVNDGEVLDAIDVSVISNVTDSNGVEISDEYISVYCGNAQNTTKDGELFSVKFLINENAPLDMTLPVQLSYDNSSISTIQEQVINDMDISINQGYVRVVDSPYLYSVSDTVIKSDDGDIYDDIPAYGNVDLEIAISKLYDEYEPGKLIAALYNENDGLISLNSQTLTEEMLGSGICTMHIDKCEEDISTVKIFVWNSFNRMIPLSRVYQIN